MLLLATRKAMPFDIAQEVHLYNLPHDLERFLSSELDSVVYGLQIKGGAGSSIRATTEYANRLAAADADNGLLRVAAQQLAAAQRDPVQFRAALDTFNGYLGVGAHVPLYPSGRAYPNALEPRCFIIMPFCDELNPTYLALIRECEREGVQPTRGDIAEGQEIIQSIWQEIGRGNCVIADLTGFNPNVCVELGIAHALGRPTLMIGKTGTEKHLFASVAKRRCHTYRDDPLEEPGFLNVVREFLTRPSTS